ncbi:hypothetical protein [Nostoc sp.]
MRYNITSRGVGARHCRAPTGVPQVNENRYTNVRFGIGKLKKSEVGSRKYSFVTGI